MAKDRGSISVDADLKAKARRVASQKEQIYSFSALVEKLLLDYIVRMEARND